MVVHGIDIFHTLTTDLAGICTNIILRNNQYMPRQI
nr:hypothetical protein YSBCXYJI_YSBCXYJI_CDS_0113 [Caudoviricetes sp.]